MPYFTNTSGGNAVETNFAIVSGPSREQLTSALFDADVLPFRIRRAHSLATSASVEITSLTRTSNGVEIVGKLMYVSSVPFEEGAPVTATYKLDSPQGNDRGMMVISLKD